MENIVSEPVETYNQIGLGLTNYVDTRKLSPILKWAGGKEQELKIYYSKITLKVFKLLRTICWWRCCLYCITSK
jgi:hypothetical protein